MNPPKTLIERGPLTQFLEDVGCLLQYVQKAANGSRIAWTDLNEDIGTDIQMRKLQIQAFLSDPNNHSDQLMTKQEFNERLNLHARTSRLYAKIAVLSNTKATDAVVGAKVRELLRDFQRESEIIERNTQC
jgi:hypothetical protein